MRSNSTGFSGLENFCSVMNLPKPMTRNYDELSNLRSNVGNVKNMQDAILASMFHVASSDYS